MKTALLDGAAPQWSAEAQARRAAVVAQAKGYFTETVPAVAAVNNQIALPTGDLHATGFGAAKGDTFTACDVAVQTAGSALTLAKFAIARASDNVIVAVTADQSGAVVSAGKKPCPFLAQFVSPEDDYYWFYALAVGTTGPALRGGSGQTASGMPTARTGFQNAYSRLAAQADLVLGTAYAVVASGGSDAIWAGFY